MSSETAASAPPRLARRALISLLDQAWLSLLNLALGLLLIRLTAKEAYGIYAQLYVAGLFAASMAEALITNPLTTLAAGSPAERREELIAHLARFQGYLSTGVALAFGVGAAVVLWHTGLPSPWMLGLAFAIYVKASAMREFRRSVTFLDHQPQRVFKLDLAYGLAMTAGIALLVGVGWLELTTVFLVLAAANVLALWRQPALPAAAGKPEAYRAALGEAWRRGKLGLMGAALAWTVNYSYLYIAAAWLGAAASADLNASRLLLMPISLSVVAWSRVARPALGVHLVRNEWAALQRLVTLSALAITALTAAYAGALWLSLPWLGPQLLGDKYAHAHTLVAAWGAYFAINGVRWVYSAVLIAQDRYGYMLMAACVSVFMLALAIGFAIPRFGTLGAILTLILVEAIDLILIWAAYRFSLRRQAAK
ncbi:MAG: hypothetical protein M0R28_01300 [Pigmentiphaga sp.]|nr:hypothetical protein [Pigmentiphaga sp.]